MPEPSEYNLSVHNPETYVALAVRDLIAGAGPAALHAGGEPTKEYLGMLALYAIRRAAMFYGKGSPYEQLIRKAYSTFDPDSMSGNLIRFLTDLLLPYQEESAPAPVAETASCISELQLSESTAEKLARAGIRSITDLLKLGRSELKRLRSLGDVVTDEVAALLEENGYRTRAAELAFPGCPLREIDLARQDPNSVLTLPVENHLGSRLYRNGIKTRAQLRALSVDELAELDGIGYEDILRITAALEDENGKE